MPLTKSGSPPPRAPDDIPAIGTPLDPVEQMEAGVSRVGRDVASQLLERLRLTDPGFLEQTVLDLLVAMGYGGAGQRARRIGFIREASEYARSVNASIILIDGRRLAELRLAESASNMIIFV